MLEDEFTHVLGKALRGHGLTPSQAAARAGIAESKLRDLLEGGFSPESARQVAVVLGLNPDALALLPTYQPKPLAVRGVERLDLPFGNERVNAWLVRAADVTILFDAGFREADLMSELTKHCGGLPDLVFITHSHPDHIGAVQRFLGAGIPVHSADFSGTIPMVPGETVKCGPLSVRACDLSGHASPSLGFDIDGLGGPVLVTGDALFAGSMGGCGSPIRYRHALDRLREVLGPLEDDAVLLPGHGPATTLGEERVRNPFL